MGVVSSMERVRVGREQVGVVSVWSMQTLSSTQAQHLWSSIENKQLFSLLAQRGDTRI